MSLMKNSLEASEKKDHQRPVGSFCAETEGRTYRLPSSPPSMNVLNFRVLDPPRALESLKGQRKLWGDANDQQLLPDRPN